MDTLGLAANWLFATNAFRERRDISIPMEPRDCRSSGLSLNGAALNEILSLEQPLVVRVDERYEPYNGSAL